MYTCIHQQTCTCIYRYMCVSLYKHVHTHIRTYIYIYMYILRKRTIRICIGTYVCVCVYIYIHMLYTCIYIYTFSPRLYAKMFIIRYTKRHKPSILNLAPSPKTVESALPRPPSLPSMKDHSGFIKGYLGGPGKPSGFGWADAGPPFSQKTQRDALVEARAPWGAERAQCPL